MAHGILGKPSLLREMVRGKVSIGFSVTGTSIMIMPELSAACGAGATAGELDGFNLAAGKILVPSAEIGEGTGAEGETIVLVVAPGTSGSGGLSRNMPSTGSAGTEAASLAGTN